MKNELIELYIAASDRAKRKDLDTKYLAALAQDMLTAHQVKSIMIKSHEQAIAKIDARIQWCKRDLEKAIAEFDAKEAKSKSVMTQNTIGAGSRAGGAE